MKAMIPTVLVLFIVFFLISQNFTYVGASKCMLCHKTDTQGRQYPIWQQSLHAKSVAALTSAAAAQMAQAMGFTGNPATNEKCLKCHIPLFQKSAELKQEGVTCEVCHGPGSGYKILDIMKDHGQAVQNGLAELKQIDRIKALCLSCHAAAHGIAFDFNLAREKIKHLVPRN